VSFFLILALAWPLAGHAAPAQVRAPLAPAPLTIPALPPAAAPLSEDRIVLRAIELARQSKSQRARFGALVVASDGRVIGEGWNRQSTKAERRAIGVGIIIHAEQTAIAQALRNAPEAFDGARVYAVGLSKDGRSYAQKIEPAFACPVCARTLERFRLSVMSSSRKGFREIPWHEVRAVAKKNAGRKWWQASYKGKSADPNIRWLPVAGLEERLRPSVDERLQGFRQVDGKAIANGVQFRQAGAATPDVLTLRIKRFFFDKILSGEKKFEYRVRSPQNDALIEAARKRGARFLRLHFQDNDVQLLAAIDAIDVVSGKDAAEPWDAEQGLAPSDKPHWRIAISSPRLIWDNPKSRAALESLR